MLLEISGLSFAHQPEKPLFRNLNLQIGDGRIVALAGESGCGKSTLLNLIYGLLDWQQGSIRFDDEPLLGPKGNIVPGEADMKFVAQNYDLMPYSTVYDNVGKFISNIRLREKREKVMELLDVVGMQEYADVFPKNLSGGQQQRVAIARALSVTPKLLLLDEPFSNLDYSRKIALREKLFSYVKQNGLSLIISTHDLQDILPWLDEIVILQEGRLIQKDSPEETYRHPYNEYVAGLFGEVNVFSPSEMDEMGLSKPFYFPTDILPTEEGQEAAVLESRFAGGYYWNKLNFRGKLITVYSSHALDDRVNIRFAE